MVAFVDTSTLFKKYVEEPGSDKLLKVLESVEKIVVAPTYMVEFSSALRQKRQLRELSAVQFDWLTLEAKKDLRYFFSVKWTEELENHACRIIESHGLRSLDSIQLASAVLAKPEIFLTSDKRLHDAAKKELKVVKFV